MRNATALNPTVSLDDILARPDVWSADQLATATVPTISSRYPELDAELPGGGWPRGALTEILADRPGVGECSLILPAFTQTQSDGHWSLLVAPPYRLNAPAWASSGIDLSRLVIVAPTQAQDALWVAEHALASGAFGAVACWKSGIDARQARRLQVAAAGHNTLAFLFRPAREASETSAAALRLQLSAGSAGKLDIRLLKRRGPPCSRTLHLDVPRPLPWREDYELKGPGTSLARPAPPLPFPRSQRTLALA